MANLFKSADVNEHQTVNLGRNRYRWLQGMYRTMYGCKVWKDGTKEEEEAK